MNMLDSIRESNPDDRKDSRTWLLWTVMGNLPIWILLIPLLSISQPVSIKMFQNGEFALFSISLLASSLYIITKEVKPFSKSENHQDRKLLDQFKVTFPSQREIVMIIVSLGGVSLILIVLSSLASLNIISTFELKTSTITIITLIVFVLSLLLGYFITIVENSSMKHKLEHMSLQEYDILRNEIESSIEEIPESFIRDFEEIEDE